MPFRVVVFVSSNLARISWCASSGMPASSAAAIHAAETRVFMCSCLLLALQLELAALRAALPGATDGTVPERQTVNLAVQDIAHGFAGLVLAIEFQVHDPAFRIERCGLDLGVVGAWVDQTADGLAVPVKDQ